MMKRTSSLGKKIQTCKQKPETCPREILPVQSWDLGTIFIKALTDIKSDKKKAVEHQKLYVFYICGYLLESSNFCCFVSLGLALDLPRSGQLVNGMWN